MESIQREPTAALKGQRMSAASEKPASPQLHLRPYRDLDWLAICRVHDLARPLELRGSCDMRAFVPIEADPEVADLKRSQKIVAEVDGYVVGFVGVDGDELAWLYVDPAHHSQGIGRRLLRQGLRLTRGAPWTIVLADNQPAIRLYQSEGFRETRRYESENAGYPCTCLRLEKGPLR
jgi:ribosomal protein S18 acetylase RimI-like enzyme